MNKELYEVYECDYGERNKQFVTLDIDKAINRSLELNSKDFCIYIDVYELDGGIIYSEKFTKDDNVTFEQLKDSLVNKTNKYWNC